MLVISRQYSISLIKSSQLSLFFFSENNKKKKTNVAAVSIPSFFPQQIYARSTDLEGAELTENSTKMI